MAKEPERKRKEEKKVRGIRLIKPTDRQRSEERSEEDPISYDAEEEAEAIDNLIAEELEQISEEDHTQSAIIRKKQEGILKVLDKLASACSGNLLIVELEETIKNRICSSYNIDENIYQGAYQIWLDSNKFISESYLIGEFRRTLGEKETLISTNKYKNCLRLAKRKGLSEEDAQSLVNSYLSKTNLHLESEVKQDASNMIASWCSSHLPQKTYKEQDIETLEATLVQNFPLLKNNTLKKLVKQYLDSNDYQEKKGIFGLGIWIF